MTEKYKIKNIYKIASLSLNIITRDMVWVVRNGGKLIQKRKPLSPGGLMDTSEVIRNCRDENRL